MSERVRDCLEAPNTAPIVLYIWDSRLRAYHCPPFIGELFRVRSEVRFIITPGLV